MSCIWIRLMNESIQETRVCYRGSGIRSWRKLRSNSSWSTTRPRRCLDYRLIILPLSISFSAYHYLQDIPTCRPVYQLKRQPYTQTISSSSSCPSALTSSMGSISKMKWFDDPSCCIKVNSCGLRQFLHLHPPLQHPPKLPKPRSRKSLPSLLSRRPPKMWHC